MADEKVMAIWRKVCPSLLKKYPGGVLAVHRCTGKWFAGRDLLQAMNRGLREHPEGGFELLMVGDTPYFKVPWRPRRRVTRGPTLRKG